MKLPAIKPVWVLYGVGAGVALLAVNAIMRGQLVTAAASTIARAPVDAFYGGAEGLFGLPDTRTADSQTACEQARADGSDWEASFVCPAASWFKGLFDGQ